MNNEKDDKKYSEQFKIDAVNLLLEQGFNIAEAARNSGIHRNLLDNWKKKFEKNTQKAFRAATPEHEELKQLRKENARLKMEKEILKKAAAFFAKESV